MDTRPVCGPPPGWPISSSDPVGFGTIRDMSGGSWGDWVGAASAPRVVRWSVTRRRSGAGRDTAGPPLKNSPRRRPDHRLCRRKRAESKATRLGRLNELSKNMAPGPHVLLIRRRSSDHCQWHVRGRTALRGADRVLRHDEATRFLGRTMGGLRWRKARRPCT